MNRRTVPLTVAVTALAMFAGCADGKTGKSDETADPAGQAVAVVNGKEISREVWDLFVKTRTGGGEASALTPEQQQETLDSLVEMYVAAEQAETDGLAKGETGARLELMRQSSLADLAGQKYLEGKEPTPEELRAEYDKQVAQMPKSEYKARHILVDSEEKARELIAALDQGAQFETLAEQNSSDSSAKDGGDLGWFPPGRMVKPFADAVQLLEKGTYTKDPVQSRFGWHVIKLEDTRELTPPGYEAVESQLGQLVRQSRFQEYLDGLVKTAKVERKL